MDYYCSTSFPHVRLAPRHHHHRRRVLYGRENLRAIVVVVGRLPRVGITCENFAK